MASVAPTRTRRGTAALMALAALTAPLAATQITIAQSTSAGPPDFSVTPIVGLPMNGLREGVHPLTGQPEFNRGVILSVSAGTPVVAPASGRVVLIMTHPGGFGDFVMLSHGAGYATCYGPLDAIAFAVGDDVAAGQRIAQVGSNVSGGDPFLFVEVSRDGAPLDPVSVLGISAAAS